MITAIPALEITLSLAECALWLFAAFCAGGAAALTIHRGSI